jgi:hypothetical protein
LLLHLGSDRTGVCIEHGGRRDGRVEAGQIDAEIPPMRGVYMPAAPTLALGARPEGTA